ncbi:MAG: zinc metalloprotease HtpX [Elusimicrobia bacterium CG08_land_8_20_14_0_20_51_18]|nr:MAG: zinc metalloprotease HtpX [Elusimicrobia bacterium CG08_land_8_20_14_0_20_51_18]
MNIYEQQAKNKRLTVMMMASFIALFLAIGLGFDFFYLGTIRNKQTKLQVNDYGYYESKEQKGVFLPFGTAGSLLFSVIMSLNGVFNGHKMVLRSVMARRAAGGLNPKERQFINVVKEMAIAAGLPEPQGYIIPDGDLNAFATGFSPSDSYIAVTEGLLETLNREELQAVVAHEMSHIRNYDIRLMTIAAALMNAIGLISDWSIRSSRYSGGRSSSSSSSRKGGGAAALFIIWIILIVLAPLISRIIALAISRQREYLADASSAELTRNPKALISALEKIRMAVNPTYAVNNGIAHMCITDPRGSLIEEKAGLVGDMFATHPPMEKRILALKVMAYQMESGSGASAG